MTRVRTTFVLVTLLMTATLTACGGNGGSATLDGTSWRLSGWSVSSIDPGDFEITASFTDGQIAGKSAVNTYSGGYTAKKDGSFSVGQLARTLMAGPEPAMRAEDTYFSLLDQARKHQAEGDELILLDGNGNQLLIFTRAQ